MSSPRISRRRSSDAASRFSPANRISPPTILPGAETSLITDSAVIDLPHPDSPTSPSSSPSPRWKLTPSTARTTPARVGNCVIRFLTSSRCATGVKSKRRTPPLPRQARGRRPPRSVFWSGDDGLGRQQLVERLEQVLPAQLVLVDDDDLAFGVDEQRAREELDAVAPLHFEDAVARRLRPRDLVAREPAPHHRRVF